MSRIVCVCTRLLRIVLSVQIEGKRMDLLSAAAAAANDESKQASGEEGKWKNISFFPSLFPS